MHMIVNLDNLIRRNYDEIKAGTYRWKDEEVEAVYKLAGSALKKIVLNELVDEYEDVLQDLVCVFFTKVIPNYDINKKITISTYSYVAFKNYYLNILRKPIIETVSLQEKISEDCGCRTCYFCSAFDGCPRFSQNTGYWCRVCSRCA